ncbi:hypothetical protein ACQP00_47935 [Dactylosporangium sp. CS-047395]|uniref:hypothetical protein n=1 Tax=Dactylosporangium sp. CS-047395 TaxID=3239936 RepID=UPI003D90F2E0
MRTLAGRMQLSSASRVGEILRGIAWPADGIQAESLLRALGATDTEVRRGKQLFEKARLERDTAAAVRERPDWWRRSGYLEQLADMAPVKLLDRDAELAELAAWCTTDEAYVWWQAPARAGKSALMSWFVLHPPPDVWVVSFFVTARLASQADSAAFTDGLLDQLTALTGEQPPPLLSPAQRDRLRRRLLADAVAKAAAAGRRLVLLVDGLDEDCGSLPGSGQASIAALLPKRQNGLKVIVVGRPDPPLPADVDADHPLRTARIRPLTASPHARHVIELADRELDEILAVDPDRHDGLGFQVLGLVAASGGGLNRDDLHLLTRRPGYQIDRLLGGVFGRTVAGRTDQRADGRVFLFTHETLRVQALDRLGPQTLADFQERLYTWADSYRQLRWPVETPAGYLIRGYFRMLKSIGDLRRMLALATDTDRHRWLRTVTGGDDTALAEISDTQHALHRAGDNHLPDIAQLAWLRNRIRRRNNHIPWPLVEARARLGQTARAEALARSLTGMDDRAVVFAELAGVAAECGQFDEAERLAMSIPAGSRHVGALLAIAIQAVAANEQLRARRLVDVAAGLVAADPGLQQAGVYGQLAVAAAGLSDRAASAWFADQAECCAAAMQFPGMRQQEVDVAGLAAVKAGDTDRAVRLLNLLPGPSAQVQQLRRLAETAARHGDREKAAAWIEQAADLCSTLDGAQDRADKCALVAIGFADLGDARRAVEMTERAVTTARQLEPAGRARVLCWCVEAAIMAGNLDHAVALAREAEEAARSVADPRERSTQLAWVAGLVAAVDAAWFARLLEEFDQSETRDQVLEHALRQPAGASPEHLHELAGMIHDPFRRAQALAGVAMSLACNGAFDDAVRCADQAEQIAQSIDTAEARTASLVAAINAMLRIGDHDRAAALAAHLEPNVGLLDPVGQQALLRIAGLEALVAVGDLAAALRLARTNENPSGDPSAITAVALAAVRAGLAARARDIVLSLPVSSHRVHTLTQVAHEHLAAGRPEQARELVKLARTTADAIGDPRDHDYALHWLPAVLCRLGDVEDARRVAGMIRSSEPRIAALVQIAETVAAGSSVDQVEQVIAEAEELTTTLDTVHPRVDALARLATAAAAAGLIALTDELLQRAAAAARLDPLTHDQVAALVAVAAAKARRLDAAETLLSERGKTSRISWSSHASNIAEVLELMIQQDDVERATHILDGISGTWRPHIQKRLAETAAQAGNLTAAENLSQSIEDPDLQAAALAALAVAAPAHAQQPLFSRALIAGGWDACFTGMAHLAPDLARTYADELLAPDSDTASQYVAKTIKPLHSI